MTARVIYLDYESIFDAGRDYPLTLNGDYGQNIGQLYEAALVKW